VLEYWVKSETGLVRRSNQDAVGIYPEHGVFVIADGMGGHAHGELASRIAVERMRQLLHVDDRPSGAPTTAIDSAKLGTAIEATHRAVREAGAAIAASPDEPPMGSTIVVLCVDSDAGQACWGYVGDSRLYRLRDGALTLLTADHTIGGSRYRGCREVPLDLDHMSVLLQAVGAQPAIEPDLGEEPLAPGDQFLLCSDGISGMVSGRQLESLLRAPASLASIGNAIFDAAMAAGGDDNASLILVRLGEMPGGQPPR